MKKIPVANWPEESGEYKAVQIFLGGKPFLRFGERGAKSEPKTFHAVILSGFLDSLGISYGKIDGNVHRDIPSPEGRRYKACGMGFSLIDVKSKKAVFRGESGDYGIGISKEHLDRIRQICPDWEIKAE